MPTAPSYWYGNSLGSKLISWGMSPLGKWGAKIALQQQMQPHRWRAPIPVICIGNATVGGAGKTPVARMVRGLMSEMFSNPAIICRGYGGKSTSAIVVSKNMDTADIVGDEALVHAIDGLTIISRDRVSGARTALYERADLIVMDDGLQNRDIAQDVRVLVVPIDTKFGNEQCIPAGPLRAPLDFTLKHTDIVVAVGDESKGKWITDIAADYELPVFFATPKLSGFTAQMFGQPLVAYAGTAFPSRFFDGLRNVGMDVAKTFVLGDHERPSERECERLLDAARKNDAILVTTEKDAVRLKGQYGVMANLRQNSRVLKYGVNMPERANFKTCIEHRLVSARSAYMQPAHQNKPPATQPTSN